MKYLLFLIVFWGMSCQTRLIPISKREVVERKGGIFKKGRKIQDSSPKSTKIFLRKSNLKVKPLQEVDNNGSLFYVNNPDNFLFYDKPPGDVGDVLPILVRVNMGEPGAEKQDNGKEAEADKLQDELLQALPEFTPSEKNSDLKVLTSFQVKVDRKLPNGDLLVSFFRISKNHEQSNTVIIKARIPRKIIAAKTSITTNDLLDVEWYQRTAEEEIERQSISWQDEYTLRLSGFDEAKSQYAQQLDTKKSDLQKIRNRLRKRINSLRQEKKNFSVARKDLDQQKRKLGETLNQYNSQIEDYKNTIEEQKSILKKQQGIIEELQGSGKSPGDEKGSGDNG